MTRRSLHIFLFAFGVLMLLLRPYMVYQMTAKGGSSWSLLQRLVKKKDDHHGEQSAMGAAMLNAKIAFRPERKLLVALLIFLRSLFKPFVALSVIPVLLPFFYQRQHQQLTSCLLI